MAKPGNWQAIAFNQSTESSNQIHSDEMAQTYGFKGGLVPGVTVSSYLIHPAVEAWGEDWLTYGSAHVVVSKPLYDGYQFDVKLHDVTDNAYRATLIDQEGTECASGYVRINNNAPIAPTKRGDLVLQKGQGILPATPQEMRRLQQGGMFALPAKWSQANNMATYLKEPETMPTLHNFHGQAYANAAYMLGLTNWVLAGNAYMNPWIHLQTDSQHYSIVQNDTNLIVECSVHDLFNKKGHEFVDLNVEVYVRDTGRPVMTAMLRAIYQLRPAR